MKFIFGLIYLGICLITAEYARNPKLLFANRKDIRLIDIQKGKISKNILVKDVNDAASVDYYYNKQGICWTDIDKEFIKCVSLDDSNGKYKEHKEIKVIRRGITSPDGMAIDWLTEKIYWADSETDKIEVAEIYGQHRKLLYWENLDKPRAIALVPSEGIMFWSDWGESPKIERAGMDGDSSTRVAIVDREILWPNGLTVDFDSRKLFWADGKLYSISCVNFDGSNRVKVIGKLKHPFAVSYFQNTLYWTDWSTETIHYCQLNSKTKCEHHSQLSIKLSPMYIHVYDQSKQKQIDSACKHNNGGCSHLCLLSPHSTEYTCACPTGIKLKDNYTCEEGPNEMLLLARRSDLRRISLDTPDHTPVVIPVSDIRHAIAVDYDPVDQFFYWTDDEAYWIQRARFNGSDQEILIHSEGLDSDGVAIDWLARNLYWSDTENNRIEVAKLDGSSRKILLRGGLEKPRAIALYPEGGLMFWTDWGTNPKIERANLDGSDRTTIVDTKLGWPNGVAVDYSDSRLYWVDASTRVIEVSDFDGNNRKVILRENLPHVFGFSLLGDYLYWTDWQKRSIERVHKYNGTLREVLVDQLPDVMGLKALSMHQKLGQSPCMHKNGGCSHLCFNRPNQQYICDCPFGLELDLDGKKCITAESFLLYTQREEIRRVSLSTYHDTELPMPGAKQASAIDFDASGRIYWPDLGAKKIFRSFMNGSKPEVIIEFGLKYPQSLAVDWIAGNVYWSDLKLNRSQWTENARKIIRSYMDGTSVKEIITDDIGRVTGLSIDYETKKLYWLDIDKKRIEYSDFDGSGRKVVVDSLSQPNGLTLFGDFIYWSDWKSKVLMKANKIFAPNITVIKKYSEFVTDLKIVSSRKISFSPCLENNGNCSQLCIPLPSSFTCACSTHYTLQDDHKTCLPPQNFLLFSEKSSVTRIMVDNSDECPTMVLPIHSMRNVRALGFDYIHGDIYWIDGKAQVIRKASQNGTNTQVVIKKDKNDPFDLVVDSGSQTIFWTSVSSNFINATRTDGVEIGTVAGLAGKDAPRSLTLHSTLGLLFFANFISPPVIEKLILSGLNREVIVNNKLRNPASLVVDAVDNSIYWADYKPSSIEVADINGKNRNTVIDSYLNNVDSIAIHGDFIYWVDSQLDIIERAHKHTGLQRSKIITDTPNLSVILSASFNLFEIDTNYPCLKEGVKCSHLCVANPSKHMTSFLMPLENQLSYSGTLYHEEDNKSYYCECPQDLILSTNLFACVPRPTCPPKHFTCISTQTCIPLQWRCDGLKECSDGSDEHNCPTSMCDSLFFTCSNGQCIDNVLVCDHTPNCQDGSDELGCCPIGQSMCRATGLCVPCSNPEQCPESLMHCSIPMSFIPTESHAGSKTIWFVSVFISVLLIIIGVALWFYCQRKPAMLDAHDTLKSNQSRTYKVVLSGGKVYTGVRGDSAPLCSINPHMHIGQNGHQALPDLCPEVVNIVSGSPAGVFIERTGVIGGVSSSSSSLTHYPRETLNPPPTPIAEPMHHCLEPHCCYPPHAAPSTSNNSYRHYKSHNRPPPPTPCSTDICDDSDFCSSTLASPHNSHCLSPVSTRYSSPPITDYDSDPYPPPPTPQTQYEGDFASYPPSPSTDRSYFIRAPCPSPHSLSVSE